MSWQTTYAERFNARAIERPTPPPLLTPFVRRTDDEIAALPSEAERAVALILRAVHDTAMRLAGIGFVPHRYDDIARREWPHVLLAISRGYAVEYVRTGRRP